jgi:glyoxylate/hydroxypyruvate reductase A
LKAPDTLVFHSDVNEFAAWNAALSAELPDLRIEEAHACTDRAAARYALVWDPPRGFFARFPGLRLVINLGAGVDALVTRTDLPDVPITRISDPAMARMMAGYVLFAVLRYARDIPAFEQAQRARRWQHIHPREPATIRVSMLGLGELGAEAAKEIARYGFTVSGWSQTPKRIEGVRCTSGPAALAPLLAQTDILVIMLPLTPQTRGLIGRAELAMLPPGACLINVARGPIVDEAALTDSLAGGTLAAATLDVFEREPLAPESPLWTMPNVLITPHLASMSSPVTAAPQIAANIRRIRAGAAPLNAVRPERGY